MRSRLIRFAAAVLCVVLPAAARAQEAQPPAPDVPLRTSEPSDVVFLVNGDRITGQIRSYAQGRLKVESDNEGTVSIKWNKIESIHSDKFFDVEMNDGIHYYGILQPSDPPGKLAILGGPEPVTVEYLSVARVTPVRRNFWKRIDGSLDLGFNYTQASRLVQFNFDVDATYRMKNWAFQADLSAFFSKQEDVVSTQRAQLQLFYNRYLPRLWVVGGGLGFDRNPDLGLELRSLVALGGGRKLIQTNQTLLIVLAGVSVNRENPVDGDGQNNAEAFLAGSYSLFTYDFPKMTFEAQLQFFPSLTESGRVRLEANLDVSREIVKDFYLSLSVFDSFDSKDPSTGQSVNDWGPVLSIGWTF